jgi:hypothetical protein
VRLEVASLRDRWVNELGSRRETVYALRKQEERVSKVYEDFEARIGVKRHEVTKMLSAALSHFDERLTAETRRIVDTRLEGNAVPAIIFSGTRIRTLFDQIGKECNESAARCWQKLAHDCNEVLKQNDLLRDDISQYGLAPSAVNTYLYAEGLVSDLRLDAFQGFATPFLLTSLQHILFYPAIRISFILQMRKVVLDWRVEATRRVSDAVLEAERKALRQLDIEARAVRYEVREGLLRVGTSLNQAESEEVEVAGRLATCDEWIGRLNEMESDFI